MYIKNWDLLWRVLEHVIKTPGGYDQTNWRSSCGTTRCIAGWAAELAGYRDRVDRVCTVIGTDGVQVGADIAALTALDAPAHHYEYIDLLLFSGGLSMGEVLDNVRYLAKEDGVTPSPLVLDEMLRIGVIEEWKEEAMA